MASTRTLPLTPAMRAALLADTRWSWWLLVPTLLVTVGAAGGAVVFIQRSYHNAPASYAAIACGAAAAIGVCMIWSDIEALRTLWVGVRHGYTRYVGPVAVHHRVTYQGDANTYSTNRLFLWAGREYPIPGQTLEGLARFADRLDAISHGTAATVADRVIAVWDDAGHCRYHLKGYDGAADAAVLPAPVTS